MEEIKKSKKQIIKKVSGAGQEKESIAKQPQEVKIKKVKVSKLKQDEITEGIKKGKNPPVISVKKQSRVNKLIFKDSSEAAKFAAKVADESKADYIKILNVGPRLAITDYFVIIGAGNTRLTRRIAEDIQANLKKYNIYAMHIEGAAEGNWILIDYDDFVVHIFTDEYRQYYDLERLWRDSKVIRIKAFDSDIDENTDEDTGENIKTGTNKYSDERLSFSDDGINMEIEDS